RPGPGSLRAVHGGVGRQVRQHHHGPHLFDHPGEGTARRLPGRDGPGHSARHRPDQVLLPDAGPDRRRRGCGLRPGGDRGHGGRHRGPAVLRGDPPAGPGSAARP
ncbi:hypothetical protein LTR94_036006, partial [Friedmanniomyces endolithicus]